ncbi:MAG: molybdopterin converting factor subunit 1 [Kangiellaceae bacterium]
MINIKVLFFANFKELLKCSAMEVELKPEASIRDLCEQIKNNGEHWHSLFSDLKSSVKIAVNQELTQADHLLKQGDEVAFFPPVTGG